MGGVLEAPELDIATSVAFPFPFPFAFVVLALTNAGAGCSEASTTEPIRADSPPVTFASRNNVAARNRRLSWSVTRAAMSCLWRSGERTDKIRW